jgi:precorrin-2 dehydrogenase/sirohydrochlorin ferrochelatase
MFPVALDLTRIPVLLAGNGELLRKRLAYLDEAGAAKVTVFSDAPSDALRQAAGARLVERLPVEGDFSSCSVILMAGLERAVAERFVGWARAAGKLVNVEDVNDLCDFYFTANVRRGDLVIAVSTSGQSPTLARKVRDIIAARFGEEWAGYVREIGEKRRQWKAEGKVFQELIDNAERFLADKGWLNEKDAA